MPARHYSALLFGRAANLSAASGPVTKARFYRIKAAALKRGLVLTTRRTCISAWGDPVRYQTSHSFNDAGGYCFACITIN